MSKYVIAAANIEEDQTEFTVFSDVDGTDQLDELMYSPGSTPAIQHQVMIVVRTNESETLIDATVGTGVLTSGENTMDVDVLIDRLQNCMREAGYEFPVAT